MRLINLKLIQMSTYDEIAFDYHNKRKKPWKYFTSFYTSIKDDFPQDFKENIGVSMDLGCGTGRHAEILSEDSKIYLGTDISYQMIKVAKKSQIDLNLTNQQWINCDIENLPFRKSTIDSTVSIAVIHHIITRKRRKKIILEISDLLKENGKFILSIWGNRNGKNSKLIKRNFFHQRIKEMKLNLQKKRIRNQFNQGLECSDIFISWTARSKGGNTVKLERLYHLYNYNEIQTFSSSLIVKKKCILGNENAGNNYFLYCKKIKKEIKIHDNINGN